MEEKTGWICPKCKTAVAPTEKTCPKCGKENVNESAGDDRDVLLG
jgi:uncharacterized OB-fold protein